jgi:hypothetical protein
MFKKRAERLNRLAEEIDKRRGEMDVAGEPSGEIAPRRVSNNALFLKMNAVHANGKGDVSAPLC